MSKHTMNSTSTSSRVVSKRTDGFNNPKWRRAAEHLTLTNGRHVYIAVLISEPNGEHGRDHRGRSVFVPARLIEAREPFVKSNAAASQTPPSDDVWHARATTLGARWVGIVEALNAQRRPVVHACPHKHRARAAAESCATKAAARLNNSQHVPGEPLP